MAFKKGYIPWNKGKKGLQKGWNKGKKIWSETNPHPMLGRKLSDEANMQNLP